MSSKEEFRERKIKILYLIANEDILTPLLTRQVIELLVKENELANGSIEIKILFFQSIAYLIRRIKNLLYLRKKLKSSGILLVIIPSPVPWPIPNFTLTKTDNGYRPNGTWNRISAKFFAFYMFPFLAYQYIVNMVNVFHSRSYPPAYAVMQFQKVFWKVRHVFDPRSDFPEENVTAGRWASESNDFKFWKEAERQILRSAQITACISREYVDHFQDSVRDFPFVLAPNNVDTKIFAYSNNFRKQHRQELGWSEDDPVFVFLGGMSSDGWHRPEFYKRFLEVVRAEVPSAKLLLLIPAHANNITKTCFAGVSGVVVRNPKYDEVPSWLSIADVGLMYMHKRKIAVGTKIGEYLAVGLPIFCNSNCLGTKRFLEENPGAGGVFDISLGDLDVTTNPPKLVQVSGFLGDRERLRKMCEDMFSNNVIASSYLIIYESLSSK